MASCKKKEKRGKCLYISFYILKTTICTQRWQFYNFDSSFFYGSILKRWKSSCFESNQIQGQPKATAHGMTIWISILTSIIFRSCILFVCVFRSLSVFLPNYYKTLLVLFLHLLFILILGAKYLIFKYKYCFSSFQIYFLFV